MQISREISEEESGASPAMCPCSSVLFHHNYVDHLEIGSGGISWPGILAVVLAPVAAIILLGALSRRRRRRRNYSSNLLLDKQGEHDGALDMHEISMVPLAGVRGAGGHVVPDGDGQAGETGEAGEVRYHRVLIPSHF